MLFFYILGLFLIHILRPVTIFAEGMPIGMAGDIHGTFTVRKIGADKAVSLKFGDNIYVGDKLQTGNNSRGRIILTDSSSLILSSETALRVDLYRYELDDGKMYVRSSADEKKQSVIDVYNRRMSVKQLSGKVRFVVSRQLGGSDFLVEADKAAVSGDFADFVITILPAGTEVAVLDRAVAVKNISNLTVDVVHLGANQWTCVKEKAPPSQPSTITQQQRSMYIRDLRHF